jgi:predicted transcriptional regulator
MPDDPDLRRLLWFLLGGSRGGENRARIINYLKKRPSNLNQLANELRLQYKLIQHHVKVLKRNSLVVTSGEGYGTMYFLNPWLEAHIQIFEEVCERLHFELG